ncbi:membrane protein [Pontibacillus halophilus JSM 076056 = DSM 19796]|uniref:Membrane protein n=1 Tax=Pontibacillus halophilus JSM 076056 = DSM 19796 TaxID=1385510 RepID=A0A0A5GP52_9BACI|nr:YitT family protein [Pontibacillus halophilus]KGX92950.1 membrane protein [Pontibacillus halophilus JSM 076056 = DSM 19796]
MRNKVLSFLIMNFGVLCVAVNTVFFLSPNNLATGGVSGLSIILNQVFAHIPVGVFMLIANLACLVLGFIFIGFKFGAKTIYTSIAVSIMVWALEVLIPIQEPMSNDVLIQLIIGQAIAAFGIAIVFHQGASTGGTDIIAMIINKYLGIDMGKAVLFSDFAIAGFSILLFGPQVGLYALFGVILNGIVIDYALQQLNDNKEIVIISSESDRVRAFIVEELGKGATIHAAKGAFNYESKEVITTILKRKDLSKLKRYIAQVDETAFVTVHNMNEILGQNFKRLA